MSWANYYFNHPDFVHKKEKSINSKKIKIKKQILKAVSNHNPGKRKNKASQVINPLFFSGRDAGGRSFLYFHLFLVRHAEVVVGGWWGRSGGHIVNNRIVIHHLIMI